MAFPVLAPLFSFFTGGGFLTAIRALSFVAFLRVFFLGLFAVGISFALNKFVHSYMTDVVSAVSAFSPDASASAFSFTGLSAWFAVHLKLVESLNIIISAYVTSLTFRFFRSLI